MHGEATAEFDIARPVERVQKKKKKNCSTLLRGLGLLVGWKMDRSKAMYMYGYKSKDHILASGWPGLLAINSHHLIVRSFDSVQMLFRMYSCHTIARLYPNKNLDRW